MRRKRYQKSRAPLGLGYDPVERVEWGTSGAGPGAQGPIGPGVAIEPDPVEITPALAKLMGELGALYALFLRDYKDSPAPAWLEIYQDGSGRVRLSNKNEPEYEFATLEEGIVKLLKGE